MEQRRSVTASDEALHARELLDLGDALLELDPDWHIIRVNGRQELLSRKPRMETLGRTFAEVWPELVTPESRSWRELKQCMGERVPVQFEEYYAPFDMWTSAHAYPVSDGGIAIFFRDITALKRAEAALRASEARARLISNNVSDLIVVLEAVRDASGAIVGWRYEDANEALAELLGTRREDLTGRTIDEVVPDRGAAIAERLARVLATGTPERYERSYQGRTFLIKLFRIGPSTTASAALDITDRKRAEDALREREQRFRMLAEAMPQIVCVLQPDSRAEYVNPNWTSFSGLDLAATKRAGWENIFHHEDIAAARECRRRVLKSLVPQDIELRYRAADGNFRWFLSRLAPVVEDGRVVRLVGSAMEIEQRKRAEEALRGANEALRETDRRKDEFLGMLSHELRNPLAPIRNSLYILDRAEPAGRQARRAKDVANRQVVHLTRIVDDLLDVTRVARGKIDLRRDELDVAALARREADDHRALMQDRNLELAVDVPDTPVPVDGDQTRLAQVLGNLLQNAAKFTPGGGRVTLTVRAEDGKAVIHVQDTGSGIEPGMTRTIFEPFTQVSQTLARSEGGLGLGLALVKGLVELHGGDVAAVSAGRGRGTDFVVTLPLAARREPKATEPGPGRPAARGGSRRVLVIDDNKDAADCLAEVVSMLGHRAEVAYDALAGLAKAAEDLPDVVLCDIGLPGMDGYEVARQLRALSASRHIQLVAVTGYARPEDVSRAVDAGFDAHVAKPPDPERLAGLLG